MIHGVLRIGDFQYLVAMLKLDYSENKRKVKDDYIFFSSNEVDKFLSNAEENIWSWISEQKTEDHNIHYGRVQKALYGFYFDRLEDIRYGLDYNLELRSREHLVSEEAYPGIYRYLIAIPGDKGWGLDRENHSFGYHIHYVQFNGKNNLRTDAIFTFDPEEPSVLHPTLYWEKHHESAQKRVDPESFGRRRRLAIYDTCTPFLGKVPKHEFKRPSDEASRLHPES
jgi:hypothetical protein